MSTKPANRRKAEQIPSKTTIEDTKAESNSDAQSSAETLTNDNGCDDDKGKIMEEFMKTYIKQQEKLHKILQKKQHLQMVWY